MNDYKSMHGFGQLSSILNQQGSGRVRKASRWTMTAIS